MIREYRAAREAYVAALDAGDREAMRATRLRMAKAAVTLYEKLGLDASQFKA